MLERSAKTLKRLGDDGAIFYRLRGRAWRVYAREEIETLFASELQRAVDMRVGKARSPGGVRSQALPPSGKGVVTFTAAGARSRRRKMRQGKKP